MKKLFIILAMLAAMNANGQWIKMNGPITNNVRDITYYNGNYYAATHGMGIIISTNNGLNWVMTPLNYTFNEALEVFDGKLFAGIQQQGVYYTSNNGNNWIPTNLNYGNYAMSLGKVANKLFVGLGVVSNLYSSSNNGTNWNYSYDKMPYCFEARGNTLFIGTYNGIYASTDTGNTFQYKDFSTRSVSSLKVKDDTTFFAGLRKAGSFPGGVYRDWEAGNHWYPTALTNMTVNTIEIYGDYTFAGSDSGVYVSSNNGTSWRRKSEGFPVPHSINVLLVNNGYIFAGLYDGGIYRRNLSEIIGIQNISTVIPSAYSLGQNYPNPFNPITVIRFNITGFPVGTSGNDKVVLKVYDVMGREVQTLVNERLNAGTYEVRFDGSSLNSGVYFYKMVTERYTETKKMLLIK